MTWVPESERDTSWCFQLGFPEDWNTSYCGVYIIHDIFNNKIYVGSTNHLQLRYHSQHDLLKKNQHYNIELQIAFNCGNVIHFYSRITSTREEAYDIEQNLLDKYRNSNMLFNIAQCARYNNFGMNHSEEHKQRIANSLRGVKHAPERVAKNKEAGIRRAHSVRIDGIFYPSLADAGQALGITTDRVRKRVLSNSSQFNNWQYAARSI